MGSQILERNFHYSKVDKNSAFPLVFMQYRLVLRAVNRKVLQKQSETSKITDPHHRVGVFRSDSRFSWQKSGPIYSSFMASWDSPLMFGARGILWTNSWISFWAGYNRAFTDWDGLLSPWLLTFMPVLHLRSIHLPLWICIALCGIADRRFEKLLGKIRVLSWSWGDN